jgi:hypothetical protein
MNNLLKCFEGALIYFYSFLIKSEKIISLTEARLISANINKEACSLQWTLLASSASCDTSSAVLRSSGRGKGLFPRRNSLHLRHLACSNSLTEKVNKALQ